MKPIFICGPKYGIYGNIKELTLKTSATFLCVLVWFRVQNKIRSNLISAFYTFMLFKTTISGRSVGRSRNRKEKLSQLSVPQQTTRKKPLMKQSCLLDF